ncbi:Adenosine deaminase-like protein [Heterocephalus glaber]|uniref:Adenosine deaminase-like protein n=1 Tax=Heterocephalus glaber TaxID=10181 RepID=G5B3H6_HETGA|nr:Adenosine deaminase-like protein [Heterocephalus glaber]
MFHATRDLGRAYDVSFSSREIPQKAAFNKCSEKQEHYEDIAQPAPSCSPGCSSMDDSSTMKKKLIAKKPNLDINNQMTMIDKGKKRTLEECFQMFQIIHQLTTEPEDILLVTKDVIKEFANDGVKYLELRSTPRRENATGMTKKIYVESILETVQTCLRNV